MEGKLNGNHLRLITRAEEIEFKMATGNVFSFRG